MEHLIISQLLFQFRIRDLTFEKLQTFYAVRGRVFYPQISGNISNFKVLFLQQYKLTDNEYN